MEKLEKSKGKDTEQAAKPDDDSHIQSFSHAGSLLWVAFQYFTVYSFIWVTLSERLPGVHLGWKAHKKFYMEVIFLSCTC